MNVILRRSLLLQKPSLCISTFPGFPEPSSVDSTLSSAAAVSVVNAPRISFSPLTVEAPSVASTEIHQLLAGITLEMQARQFRFEQLEAGRLRAREEARAERARMREITAAARRTEFDAAQALRSGSCGEQTRSRGDACAAPMGSCGGSSFASCGPGGGEQQRSQRELLDNTHSSS
jgi:hypothetical protein